MEGPFFEFCLSHGKDVMAVLKANNRALLEDAKGLFDQITPEVKRKDKRTIRYWDADGFTSSENISVPLRVLHTEETHTQRKRIAGQWKTQTETSSWYWATTLTTKRCPASILCKAGHHRWDIENDNFNTLGRDWAMNHCFKHDPAAIINFILTLFIAFVLLQSFYYRNIKGQMRRIFNTLISITSELHAALASGCVRIPYLTPP